MSTTDLYWRIKEAFAATLDRPPAERDEYLRSACGADERLFSEVRQMLDAHERAAAAVATRGPVDLPASVVHTMASPAESVGTTIGPYKLLELIGEGGMGVVYKAEQRSPVRRIVALKLIKLGMDTRQVIARFESERQALAVMNHPNVAAVYDAGATETGRPYFVMEYVPGTPITSFCDRHKYTTRQRLELFMQACDAIQHAHTKAIIHRDVKPGNILVTLQDDDRPVVKVIDFGIARATAQRLTERTVFTEAGQLIGTPEYMSPEQADLNPTDVDTRSDIYSLGVVLYELLAGALPFDAKTLREAAYAQIQAIIREVDPPRPSTRLSSMHADAAAQIAARHGTQPLALERELRSELEWIPLKAMRKDRARRYRTAAELSGDIQNYLNDLPLLAAPESAAYRVRKFVRRNKVPALATAAVLVVLVAGAIGTTVGLIGQSRQRAVAEHQRAVALQHEAEAKDQAAIAHAVSRFQADMLSGADPDRMRGDQVTVLQSVAAAVSELDAGALKDQPRVEAAVRETIGNTLSALGRYGEAEVQLRRALMLRRKRSVAAPPDGVAESLNDLGGLLRAQGKLAEAEPLLRESLEIRRRTLPSGDPLIGQTLDNLGLLERDLGHFGQAEQRFREALDLFKAIPDKSSDVAAQLNNLALALEDQAKFADAEALFRQSLQILRASFPPGHPQIIVCTGNLAWVLQARGRFDEVRQLCEEAVRTARQNFPAGHPRIAAAVEEMGVILQSQGRYAEAEPLLREGLQIRRATLPAIHRDTAQAMSNLAGLYQSRGQLADAEALFREALDVTTKALPAENPEVALATNNLGLVLRDRGRLSEAEELFRSALQIARGALPKQHPLIAVCLNNLGLAAQAQENYSQAEAMFREAVDINQQALLPAHPVTARSLTNLAVAVQQQGRLDEAEPLFRQALEMRIKSLSPEHPDIAEGLNNLARLLCAREKFAEAEPMYRKAMTIFEKSVGKNHWLFANAQLGLGRALIGLHRWSEAEALLLDAEPALASLPGVPPGRHPICVSLIIDLYRGWEQAEPGKGYAAKADQWKARPATSQAATSRPTTSQQ